METTELLLGFATTQKTIKTGESTPLLKGSERSLFLEDYLSASREVDKEFPGHLDAEQKFSEEFIDHPERFRPTIHAIKSAYAKFIIKPSGQFCWIHEVGSKFPVMAGVMRNVEIKVVYGYSSTLSGYAAVVEIWAEVKQPDGSYKKMRSGGVSFSLRDWVEMIPDEEF